MIHRQTHVTCVIVAAHQCIQPCLDPQRVLCDCSSEASLTAHAVSWSPQQSSGRHTHIVSSRGVHDLTSSTCRSSATMVCRLMRRCGKPALSTCSWGASIPQAPSPCCLAWPLSPPCWSRTSSWWPCTAWAASSHPAPPSSEQQKVHTHIFQCVFCTFGAFSAELYGMGYLYRLIPMSW